MVVSLFRGLGSVLNQMRPKSQLAERLVAGSGALGLCGLQPGATVYSSVAAGLPDWGYSVRRSRKRWGDATMISFHIMDALVRLSKRWPEKSQRHRPVERSYQWFVHDEMLWDVAGSVR